jgi:hypothetical protein
VWQFNCTTAGAGARDGRITTVTKTLPTNAAGTYALTATFRQRDVTRTYSYDARLYALTMTKTTVRAGGFTSGNRSRAHSLYLQFGGAGACAKCADGQKSDATGVNCVDCGVGWFGFFGVFLVSKSILFLFLPTRIVQEWKGRTPCRTNVYHAWVTRIQPVKAMLALRAEPTRRPTAIIRAARRRAHSSARSPARTTTSTGMNFVCSAG